MIDYVDCQDYVFAFLPAPFTFDNAGHDVDDDWVIAFTALRSLPLSVHAVGS